MALSGTNENVKVFVGKVHHYEDTRRMIKEL